MFKRLILFYRRLLVLTVFCLFTVIILMFQLGRLTLLEGNSMYAKAQVRLHSTSYLPSWRGNIIDRNGKTLAVDVASYSISIDWDVITGDRAVRYAREDARDSVGLEHWKTISPEMRQSYVNSYLPARQSELSDFWNIIAQTGGVELFELEDTLKSIRLEVEHTAQVVWVRQEEAHRKRFGEDVPFVARPIREQKEPHIVLPRVSDEIAISFELLSRQFDGVIHVDHSRQRDYPNKLHSVVLDRSTLPKPMRQYDSSRVDLIDVADLLIGDVRQEVWKEDIQENPFRKNGQVNLSGYRPGDEVGKRGLEKSLEKTLRGSRGKVVKHRNGDELSRTQIRGGSDVQVTLDIDLQARIEAILSPEFGMMEVQDWHRNSFLPEGTPLRGAVVVLDVESSEILAMASTPALRDERDKEGYPWLNRASDGLYPPGSIIKPLVLAAAITEEKIQSDGVIDCTGHYFDNVKDSARCWIYRENYKFQTHGSLSPVDAIARSCNIFFYELGTRLGFVKLLEWLQLFGMSEPLSSKLVEPLATGQQGHVPSDADIIALKKRGALAFETVSISIGQGALTWSPLHAASAYATLARRGIWKSPTLIKTELQEERDLLLDSSGVDAALAGLHDSVTKRHGTGSILRFSATEDEPLFNVNRVRIWGKTGTAEAPPYRLNRESKLIDGLDHSWFLVMASPINVPSPTHVVAVLVEHGGSGGRVAGPIANQILHALQDEGYLEVEK